MLRNLIEKLEEDGVYKKILIFVFLSCFAYWIFLIYASEMSIFHDAMGYEEHGRDIYEKGWKQYFRMGPTREPLYFFSVSWSMHLADFFSASYQHIQKYMQFSFLFISQLLVLGLLKKFKVHNLIKLITIIYMGISPALINAAASLYSEIAVLPFALLGVWKAAGAWGVIRSGDRKKIIIDAVIMSIAFAGAAYTKGTFIIVICLFLMVLFIISILFAVKEGRGLLINAVSFILISLIAFMSPILTVMLLNKKYNGHFEYTHRYHGLLFANAHKRSIKLTKKLFLANLSSIPGQGVCEKNFDEQTCRFVSFLEADRISNTVKSSLLQPYPESEHRKITKEFTVQRIKESPLNYVFYMFVEGSKMFFWESTKIGYVRYPPAIKKLYNKVLFKNALRLIVSLITVFSVLNVLIYVIQNRNVLFGVSLKAEKIRACAVILFVIFTFILLHSLLSVLTRYAIPIAPLFLVCIAYSAHILFFNNQSQRPGAGNE